MENIILINLRNVAGTLVADGATGTSSPDTPGDGGNYGGGGGGYGGGYNHN